MLPCPRNILISRPDTHNKISVKYYVGRVIYRQKWKSQVGEANLNKRRAGAYDGTGGGGRERVAIPYKFSATKRRQRVMDESRV